VYLVVMLLVGRQEGHPAWKKTGCWFVVGDDLTVALRVLLQLSPTISIILGSNKAG